MVNNIMGKSLCVVTGASRGFGKTIAELLFQEDGILQEIGDESKIILIAGATSDLQVTKDAMMQYAPKERRLGIETISVDFKQPEDVQKCIEDLLVKFNDDFSNLVLFNNAGHLGDVTKLLRDIDDPRIWKNHLNINVISPAILVSKFCKHFINSKCLVVNTSSKASLQPFRGSGMYCIAKSAMDMYMRSLTTDSPEIRTLNYAPGPMETDMAIYLCENTIDEETKHFFNDLRKNNKFVDCMQSAKKMMRLLKDDSFESGIHIDFYDEI